ncbi:septum formation initiator [Pantoea anthophila]|uniref:septum formation initiator n=1 Tax=Pantoea anthophila TaxID=470931 RepID=UPI003CF064C3
MSINSVSDNVKSKEDKWNYNDTTWMLCLFGTAIGAGVLFLPINAGIGGVIPLVIVAALAFPVTYFAHRALARLILSTTDAQNGINGAILEHFGEVASKIFNVIYFFAIFTILLMYSVAVTNTAESFIVHQLSFPEPNRAVLSLILISLLLIVVRFGQEITVKVMSALVYPFIASLLFLSVWLIPQWNSSILDTVNQSSVSGSSILFTLWMTFPVLVLSFNHYPIISPFVVDLRKRYGEEGADKKCSVIQRYGYIMMVCVVLFFVFSCVLSLSQQDLALAKSQNISILSYLANHFDTPVMVWMAPVIAFVAIIKSFLGHYIGAHETAVDMIHKETLRLGMSVNKKTTDRIVLAFIIITCWYTACVNPSILGIIESISGPTGAVIVLLLPMYAIHKIPALKPYRGKTSNVFITITGLITVTAIFYGIAH